MVGRLPHEGQALTLAIPILYLLLFIGEAVTGVDTLSGLTTLRAELYVCVTVEGRRHMIIVA